MKDIEAQQDEIAYELKLERRNNALERIAISIHGKCSIYEELLGTVMARGNFLIRFVFPAISGARSRVLHSLFVISNKHKTNSRELPHIYLSFSI